ncbi:hypothetical protein [Paludisphaera mucosa]|uniref:Translocation protein TolB n=1 Tax=Paludisphaera mucosa TaxID=3030827 RepID=A0ABT6F639_9BACT|nr:hypothetical protein [Paludisphaera mucosa]MDG3002966.1 hypothetical protein [Paludisphaera mucosa]
MFSSLAGLSCVLSAALMTSSPLAPVDWSRDGRWIAYTLVDSPDAPALPPGWLLAPSGSEAGPTSSSVIAGSQKTFRVWATRVKGPDSVLIEESKQPLSSPTWGADGRTLVYGRFVSSQPDSPSSQRGRYEVVVQSGLDQKRVVVVQPDLELEAAARSSIPFLGPTLSADGRRLAVPRPGPDAGVWVVHLDEDRATRAIDEARMPAWSPDGHRLAYLKSKPGPDGEPVVSVHLLNPAGTADRVLSIEASLTASFLTWGLDGQSLLMIANPRRGPFRNTQVDLVRVGLDTGQTSPVSTLEAVAPTNAPRRFRGPTTLAGAEKSPAVRVGLALDGEQEQAVCLVDTEGQDQVVKWGNLHTQNTFKRFHPLDAGLQIGSPAVAPDGRSLVFRVEDGGAGLVALLDLNSEEVTLVAPDAGARIRWLDRLAACAVTLLQTWLPSPDADGAGVRATVLPLLAELGGVHPRQFRLKRLAKFASGLVHEPGDPVPASGTGRDGLAEFRLLFAYLNQDYTAAERHLGAIEATTTDPHARLRWLCLRAQILLSEGEVDRARGMIAYIDRETQPQALSIEDVPSGFQIESVANPQNAWAKHLAQKATQGALVRGRNGQVDPQAGLDGQTAEMGGWDVDRMPNLPFAPNPGVEQGLVPLQPDELGVPPQIRIPGLIEPPAPGLQPPARMPRFAPPPGGIEPGRLPPQPPAAGLRALQLEIEQ